MHPKHIDIPSVYRLKYTRNGGKNALRPEIEGGQHKRREWRFSLGFGIVRMKTLNGNQTELLLWSANVQYRSAVIYENTRFLARHNDDHILPKDEFYEFSLLVEMAERENERCFAFCA